MIVICLKDEHAVIRELLNKARVFSEVIGIMVKRELWNYRCKGTRGTPEEKGIIANWVEKKII